VSTDVTTALLDLAARAHDLPDPQQLRSLLARAHPLYCQACEEVRTQVRAEATRLDDTALRTRCTEADAPWEPGTSRQDAVTDLVFAVFDATPAALAYQSLAEIAHRHHTGLVD
jgi:hypothetical protein